MTFQSRIEGENKGKQTLNQLVLLRPLLQVLLQTVCSTLAIELLAGRLKSSVSVLTIISDQENGKYSREHPRSYIGVQQDVAVLEVLHFRAGLEVFLQRVATLVGWGKRLFDGGHYNE